MLSAELLNLVVGGVSLLHLSFGAFQPTNKPTLMPEEGVRFSNRDGAIELEGSRGWLRLSRVYLDFRLTFEFRLKTPDADAGVIVRTWTGRGGWPDKGYRIRIPASPADDPAKLLVARRQQVTIVESGGINLRAADEWQQVDIEAIGRRVRVLLNGSAVGVAEIDTYGGLILFDNRKGRIELRSITIASLEEGFDKADDTALRLPSKPKDAGIESPVLIREVRPNYTPEAMRRQVQGRVDMEAVVLPDGSVGRIRITRALDPDLDLSAVAAVRAWKFKPGRLKGAPVPVLVEIEMTFTLR